MSYPDRRSQTLAVALLSQALLMVPLLTCREAAERQSTAPARSDSAGVKLIKHGLLASNSTKVYRPEYLLTIGQAQGPAEVLFGQVADAAVLSDGKLAVLDRHAAEVRLFSPTGEFIRKVGRRGGGPGEFSGDGTAAILPLPSGLLAVPDLLNESIAVFASTGKLEATHSFSLGEAALLEWQSVSGDTVIVRASRAGGETFIARSVDGSWQDTLVVLESIEQRISPTDSRTPLLPDHWVWATSRIGEFAVARMTRPEVMVYQAAKPLRRISWAGTGHALTEAEVEALLGIVARRLGAATAEGGIPQQVRDRIGVPDRVHAIADLEIGPEGMVMVQRVRPVEDMDRRILAVFRAEGFGGQQWDVFSISGEYLGVLNFGENVEVFRVEGDTIIGVREGELGVSRVFLARFPETLLLAAARQSQDRR